MQISGGQYIDSDTCTIPLAFVREEHSISRRPLVRLSTLTLTSAESRCVTAPAVNRALNTDFIETAFNTDHSIAHIVELTANAAYSLKTDGSGDKCVPGTSTANLAWDPTDPNAYYFMPQDGSKTSKKAAVSSSSATTVIAYPETADSLTTSSDGQPSR